MNYSNFKPKQRRNQFENVPFIPHWIVLYLNIIKKSSHFVLITAKGQKLSQKTLSVESSYRRLRKFSSFVWNWKKRHNRSFKRFIETFRLTAHGSSYFFQRWNIHWVIWKNVDMRRHFFTLLPYKKANFCWTCDFSKVANDFCTKSKIINQYAA